MADPPAAAQSSDRLQRALVAFVSQELSAPAAAIIGFAEILLEDARRHRLDTLAPDLERIREAGLQLRDILATLVDPTILSSRLAGGNLPDFKGKLRHDLRTPLNGIKGYGEMVMEEARDGGHDALLHDLTKLLGAADQLLGQIDAVVERTDTTTAQTAGKSIQPVSELDASEQIISSRILVVDDTAANRDLLSRRLTRDGHVSEAVEDGRTALERLTSDAFDLVLLDLMMPGMNGFEVLCRIKADPQLRHLPVIMISALDEIDSIVRCIEAGAEDYLPKPFNPILLRARINASLEKKRLRDREQAVTEQLRAEKEKTETLLLNILPKTIIARMREGETAIADRYSEVSILFSDLVGFTDLASRFSPGRVVELLNHLFSEFDRLAAERGLEKIKTIGDAYMVAGGLPEPHPEHATAVADMALGMIEVVKRAATMLGETLQVRIGIHTGAVIAGVIGKHKFIYDVWGDTVNTASRMETYGEPDQIHVSAATYLRIRDRFDCDARGPLKIKGKGLMETYFLRRPTAGHAGST